MLLLVVNYIPLFKKLSLVKYQSPETQSKLKQKNIKSSKWLCDFFLVISLVPMNSRAISFFMDTDCCFPSLFRLRS